MNNTKRPDAVAALPAQRYVTVIAQDPSVRQNGPKGPILMAKIAVPAEDLIAGPIGYRVQVVDYDSTTRRFNGAHDLPDNLANEPPAWAKGDAKILDDFRFHAQNVYALVMKTLARFEFALGRRVGWSFRTHQLKVSPHGMLDANAFYSPREEGLVFGYFAFSGWVAWKGTPSLRMINLNAAAGALATAVLMHTELRYYALPRAVLWLTVVATVRAAFPRPAAGPRSEPRTG